MRISSKQVAQPALAVTGVNNEEDFTWVLIQLGISAFLYFLVAPVCELFFINSSSFLFLLWELNVKFICFYVDLIAAYHYELAKD